MPDFATPPLRPLAITFDRAAATLTPQGPTLERRMSDLEGLFLSHEDWQAAVADGDPVVYRVQSSPVPEADRELPQSITTIEPGTTGGELWNDQGPSAPRPPGRDLPGTPTATADC